MVVERQLAVHALCTFASWDWKERPFRPNDHRGRFVAHAIKGLTEKIKGKYETLSVGPNGAQIRIDENNTQPLVDFFYRWAAEEARDAGLKRPVFLAIPSSKATRNALTFRTAELAAGIARAFGDQGVVSTALRFRKERLAVHEGGSRATIKDDMLLIAAPPPGEIVLVDDLFTWGAHAEAAVSLLGLRTPAMMICGAYTAHDPPDKPINPPPLLHKWRG